MIEVVVIVMIGVVVYAYAGYYALLAIASSAVNGYWLIVNGGKKQNIEHRTSNIEHSTFRGRSVSVVVCVRNGEDLIERRIKNLLAQEGVPDEYEIIVASDGSTDRTVVRARELSVIGYPLEGVVTGRFCQDDGRKPVASVSDRRELSVATKCNGRSVGGRSEGEPEHRTEAGIEGFPINSSTINLSTSPRPRVRVVEFGENRGKAAVLNEVIPQCKGEIVVLCDVRQEFAPDAVAELCKSFGDEKVGAVSGELVFRRTGRNGSEKGMNHGDTETRRILNSRRRLKASAFAPVCPLLRRDKMACQGREQRERRGERCVNFPGMSMPSEISTPVANEREERADVSAGNGIRTYWGYEKMLRKMESAVDSTNGCTGAIYAIRKDQFKPIDRNLILDDVAIPMLIMMQGKRVMFNERAKAYDEPSHDFALENRRKIRTLAGNFQLVAAYPRLLVPFMNRIWFQFVSHKVLRLLCPWLLLGVLGGSLWLALESSVWLGMAAVQVVFYALAGLGIVFRNCRSALVLSLPAAFVMLNWAAVAALFHFASGRLTGAWNPTE